MRYVILLELNVFINQPSNSLLTTGTSLQKQKGETLCIQGLTKTNKQSPNSAVPSLCQNNF